MKDSENNYIKTNKITGYNELVESMETVAQEATSQEILDAIGNIPEPDLSDVAKESTLTHGVQDIREDISHIQIDTSDLAKQGTNTSISLTTMDSKLGNYVLIQDEEYQYALSDLISRLD